MQPSYSTVGCQMGVSLGERKTKKKTKKCAT